MTSRDFIHSSATVGLGQVLHGIHSGEVSGIAHKWLEKWLDGVEVEDFEGVGSQ